MKKIMLGRKRFEKCPVCSFYTYERFEGDYDEPDEFGSEKQISPDFYQCHNACCGFSYSQHCDPERSETKMVEAYRREQKFPARDKS